MAETLPPYSGSFVSCPKCNTGVKATWHRISLHKGFPCTNVRPPRHFEHICRTCPYCGYGWIEATADAEAGDHAPAEGSR